MWVIGPGTLGIGAFVAVRARSRPALVCLGYAALFMGVFIATGAAYAKWFPWYFMPPLIPLAALQADGIGRTIGRFGSSAGRILMTFVVCWIMAMTLILSQDARVAETIANKRERSIRRSDPLAQP